MYVCRREDSSVEDNGLPDSSVGGALSDLQHGIRTSGPQGLRKDAQAHLSPMEEVVT